LRGGRWLGLRQFRAVRAARRATDI